MRQTDHGSAPRLRVLQSFGVPRPTTNPYLVQLVHSLPPEVEVQSFSWRTALTGQYDVLHVHWPELLLRGRTVPRTVARYLATLALLARCRGRRTAVVRTVHNVRPHEDRGPAERAALRLLDRATTIRVVLNVSDARDDPDAVLVPHGHYRDWYARAVLPAPVAGRLAFVGLVRPYKNVEHLIGTFGEVTDPGASLEVAGAVNDLDLRDRVQSAASVDDRVHLRLQHVEDDEMVRVVGEASAVVLPYSEMGNSGVTLLALSLDRPVLVPDTPANRALAEEVGGRWVTTFDPPLAPADLEGVIGRSTDRWPRPDLDARDWPLAGRALLEVYRTAVGLSRRRGAGGRRAPSTRARPRPDERA